MRIGWEITQCQLPNKLKLKPPNELLEHECVLRKYETTKRSATKKTLVEF